MKLDLLTNTDMLLMVEKGIRGGIYHTIYWYVETNHKYWKRCDKNKESSNLKHWGRNKLYRWALFQELKVEQTSQFNEDLIKSHKNDNDERYFIEADLQYPKQLHELQMDLPFLPERMKIEKVGKFLSNLHHKK